jgi:hypothetical protein
MGGIVTMNPVEQSKMGEKLPNQSVHMEAGMHGQSFTALTYRMTDQGN